MKPAERNGQTQSNRDEWQRALMAGEQARYQAAEERWNSHRKREAAELGATVIFCIALGALCWMLLLL